MKNNETDEKKEILEALGNGELKRSPRVAYEMKVAQRAARDYLLKNKRINIRLSTPDLYLLKRKAAEEGMPYQTLISSVLHKYVTGK